MKSRLSVIIAVAVLAFAGGWFVRGLNPELNCKAKGGFYSETIRTCIFAEPSVASVNEAQQAAKWLIEDHGDQWRVEITPTGQMGGGVQMSIRKKDGTVIGSSRTQ